MLKTLRTICFLIDNDEILLAETIYSSKYRKFTGIGGEISNEKNLAQDTTRYLYKDLRITVYSHDLNNVGVLHRVSENEKNEIIADETLYVYTTEKWQGEIKETPGRKPSWFTQETLPYESTLEYEKEWLPLVLNGENVLVEILEKKSHEDGEFELINIAVRNTYS